MVVWKSEILRLEGVSLTFVIMRTYETGTCADGKIDIYAHAPKWRVDIKKGPYEQCMWLLAGAKPC